MSARRILLLVPPLALFSIASIAAVTACVPPGNSTKEDSGGAAVTTTAAFRPSFNVMTTVFEDNFDRPTPSALGLAHSGPSIAPMPIPTLAVVPSAAASGAASSVGIPPLSPSSLIAEPHTLDPQEEIGPNWHLANTRAWHIENGRLCGQHAQNHGVWLTKVLPINARIEFDAISDSPDGDLKAEVWGDGQSAATAISYTNATSYLAILGGWQNKFHVLARINEHGNDRKQIIVDKQSDDPREKPVEMGQSYRFKIERNDGHTVRWSVNGLEYLEYDDHEPLVGFGHDHFGFNDWNVKVCFDNVKVTPLP